MRVGLLGDTHVPEAGADLPDLAYAALVGCDRILHCGDLHTIDVVDRLERIAPTMVARGNGDTRTRRRRRPGVADDPRVVDALVFELGGLVVGLTHDLQHLELQDDHEVVAGLERCFGQRVDIAVSGDSHVPMVRGLADGRALVNPGSPTMPYGYLGLVGTIGFLDVEPGEFEVTILDLATGDVQLRMAGPGLHPREAGPRPVGGR